MEENLRGADIPPPVQIGLKGKFTHNMLFPDVSSDIIKRIEVRTLKKFSDPALFQL